MARPTNKTPKQRADEILASIERQMRGAANAAKRSGAPLTEAGVNEETRAALLALLEPLWADVQAGIKGVKVPASNDGPSLLTRAAEKPKTKK